MSRKLLSLSLLILILILAFGGVAQAQDKTLYWQRYDVDLAPQTNGDLHVAETQELVFTNGTFRYGQRAIPHEPAGRDQEHPGARAGWPGVRVRRDGRAVHLPRLPGRRGDQDPLQLPAHQRQPAHHRHRLRRDRRAALLPGERRRPALLEGDPGGQPVPDAVVHHHAARARAGDLHQLRHLRRQGGRPISSPASAMPRSRCKGRSMPGRKSRWWPNGSTASWPASPRRGSASWISRPRRKQAQQAFQQRWGPVFNLGFLALAGLFAIGGPVLLYLWWYRKGRDHPVGLIADYLPEPPSDLPAGHGRHPDRRKRRHAGHPGDASSTWPAAACWRSRRSRSPASWASARTSDFIYRESPASRGRCAPTRDRCSTTCSRATSTRSSSPT